MNSKISANQFKLLVVLYTVGSSILIAPGFIAIGAKQDAWIASIVGTLVSMLFILLYNALASRFPGLTVAEYSEKLLGKWAGKLVSFLFFGYIYTLSVFLLREIGDFLTTQIMPETPIDALNVIFLFIVIMAVRLGLEPLTRAGEIFFPWIVLLFFFLTIMLLPQVRLSNITPVLENGLKPVLRGLTPLLALPYLELVVFLMIIPAVHPFRKTGTAFMQGMLIGSVFIIITSALSILVLGASLTENQMYPSYSLAKMIHIGNFLQRLEVLMAGVWFLTIFFKLSVCFYSSVRVIQQTLHLKEYRFLTYPLGMITVILAIVISPNHVYFNDFASGAWIPYSLTIGVCLPLLLLAVAMIRRVKQSGN